jgi:hypothetical protein
MANTYSVGQQVKVEGTFYNESEVATDPTTADFYLRKPDGTTVQYEYPTGTNVMTRVSAGRYYFLVTPIAAGRYYYGGEGDGMIIAAEDGSELYFDVRTPIVIP